MNNWSNPQLWILLLVFGFGALRWIVVQLQEQAKIRAARERARREYEETLRTGRTEEAYPNRRFSEAKAGDELALRRQTQLKELRRRQGDRSQLSPAGADPRVEPGSRNPGESIESVLGGVLGGVIVRAPGQPLPGGRGRLPLGPAGVVIQRIPGATGPISTDRGALTQRKPHRGGSSRPATTTSTPVASPTAHGPSLDHQRRREQAEREAASRRASLQEQTKISSERRSRLTLKEIEMQGVAHAPMDAQEPALGFSLRSGNGRPLPASELRRLLILGEILGRPVAERDSMM